MVADLVRLVEQGDSLAVQAAVCVDLLDGLLDGGFQTVESLMAGAEIIFPAFVEKLLEHEIIMVVKVGLRMDISVGITIAVSRERASPEDEELAGKGAGDGLDHGAGVGFAATERGDVGEDDVALRGQEDVF